MNQIPASTASPTTLIQDVSAVLPPCLSTPTLEPGLQPRELGSLFETITALRMALASVSASALSLSSELVASLDDLRATTASIAASASSQVLAAQASVSDAISSAQASAASATAHQSGADGANPEEMGKQISVPIAIAAIVATAVGTCLLSLLGYYLSTRRRKAKHREHEEEKEVNAALDRAIVSYIVKELPSPHGSAAPPDADGPQQSQPAMTTALDAKIDSPEDGGLAAHSPQPAQEEPPTTPTADRRQSLLRPETSVTGTSTKGTSRPLRRTASSHFMDSADRVYASILASPLERLKTRSSPRQDEPVPAARDDVGWPLPARESWL